MPYFDLRKSLSDALLKHLQTLSPEFLKFTSEQIESEFGVPPNPKLGHVALPCFKFGKLLKAAPGKIAVDLAAKFSAPGVKCAATGPYLNFRWDTSELYEKTFKKISDEGNNYGRDESGKGKTVLLEYPSANIAKPLFFHHIRSTLIGNTLSNIYRALGYPIQRINFVGDWGAQFARLVAAYEMWGDDKKLNSPDLKEAMAHLLEIYVRFHKELEDKPEYAEKANECLIRMENKNEKAMDLWRRVRAVSLKAMDKTLERLQVGIDLTEGESHYVDHIAPMLDEVKKKADAKMSEGAWIVELPDIEPPALIQKKDGTTLYMTRDIAAAIDRYNRFKFHKSLYVVGEQQKLHFKQLFGVLKKMGLEWAKDCEHLSYGTVLFNSERMSTREGRAIYLEDVLNEATKLALEAVTEKNPALNGKEQVAEMVGIGAVVFGELSTQKMRDINFDWKQILAFDGETGPYVQYSLVRCESMLSKAPHAKTYEPEAAKSYTFSPEEDLLVFTLGKFRSVLHQCINDNEPYHLTYYLLDVAKVFNRFYYRFPVLQAADPTQKTIRLSLVKATHTVLTNGLKLLGISCPKEM